MSIEEALLYNLSTCPEKRYKCNIILNNYYSGPEFLCDNTELQNIKVLFDRNQSIINMLIHKCFPKI